MKKSVSMAFASLLFLLSLQAKGEDVFSGPVTSGPSIPVNFEREFRYEQLQKAQLLCAERAAQSLWRQEYGSKPISNATLSTAENGALVVYKRSGETGSLKKVTNGSGFAFGIELTGADGEYLLLLPRGDDILGREFARLKLVIGRETDENPNDSVVNLFGPGFPRYSFENVTRDQGLDRFGRPIQPEYTARVQAVLTSDRGDGVFYLENRDSSPVRPSSFAIDYSDIAKCYVDSLQVD